MTSELNTPAGARPLGLITGASSGIGEEFARQLAATHDLLLVARSEDRLRVLSEELAAQHPRGAFTVRPVDLGAADGAAGLVARLAEERIELDLLVNNAGIGHNGAFADQDPAAIQTQLQLNALAVALLSRGALPGMLARGRGTIINVASTAAFQPIPTMALYAATKAFVLSLGQALSVETDGSGVRVLTLCPGPTETGFFAAAGGKFLTRGRQTPEQVVTTALAGLAKGRSLVIPGLLNVLTAQGNRVVPRAVVTRVSAWMVRRKD